MIITRKYLVRNFLSKPWVILQRESNKWMISQKDVCFRKKLPLDQVFFVLVFFLTLNPFKNLSYSTALIYYFEK